MKVVLTFLVALLGAFGVARGQAPLPDHATPIATLLDSAGALVLDSSFAGSLDLGGFRMVLDRSGRPLFVPETMSAADDTLDSVYRDYPGDEFWSESFGPPGIDGPVHALAMLGGQLYVGGRFTVTGNVLAYNISRWNGRKWSKLRDGVNGTVRAMAVINGLLYVGGTFKSAGGEPVGNLAVYDPSQDDWSQLGFDIQTDGGIYGMAVARGVLYITGEFIKVHTRGDDLAAYGIAAWNGTYWTTFGSGMEGSLRTADWGVGGRAILVDGSDVYVGGIFTRIGGVTTMGMARWDGQAWSAMPTPLSTVEDGIQHGQPAVCALAKADSTIIVGGCFRSAGATPLRNVARWDPRRSTWSPLGDGLSDTVYAIAVRGHEIVAGGAFEQASGRTVNRVARFDGAAWVSMDGGVFDTVPPAVYAIALADTGLFIGGRFIIAGTTSAHHVAWWSGSRWYPLAQNPDESTNCNGTDGNVHALVADGDRIYAGGDFLQAGGEPARRVAMWDGSEWTPLAGGIGGTGGFVRALAVHDGELYAGGIFDVADGQRVSGIARWDGTRWSDVGGGVGGETPYVFALAVSGDDLYVAGAFTSAGGLPAARVARWSFGSERWSPVGDGVAGDSSEYVFISTLAVVGDSLIAGGDFARAGGRRARRIACWDGERWSSMTDGRDTGANARVHCLVVHGGTLFAGGEFTSIGDSAIPFVARLVGGRWTGAVPFNAPDGPVYAMTAVDSLLFLGGSFATAATMVGDTAASNIATTAGGRSPRWLGRGVNAPVRALCSIGDAVYAGGDFTMAGVVKADHVAMWDRYGWSSLGSDPTSGVYGVVRAVTVDGPDVYIGGSFTAVGGVRARNVARWDGRRWRPIGRGRENGVGGTVLAVEPLDGSVYVGGAFTSAGTQPIGYLARWDGLAWRPLGSGIGGSNPYVFALLADGTDLYVGGAFATAGGLSANRIARYDTRAGAWHVLDSGVAGGSYYTYVSSLAGDGSDLAVAGNFALAGAVPANNVARWNGTSWSALGAGLNRSVFSLAHYRGDLYACGEFTAADTAMRYVARWDGVRWGPVGRGLNLQAYDLASDGQELYAGGRFQLAGNSVSMGIARWNGVEWKNLGKGIQHGYRTGRVYSVDAGDSGVFVGGDFTVAGGKSSYYFGRWYRPPGAVDAVPAPATRRAAGDPLLVTLTPNPASSSVVVSAAVPRRGRVRITVEDLLGRTLSVLHDDVLDGDSVTVIWDSRRAAAGPYVVHVESVDATASALLMVRR